MNDSRHQPPYHSLEELIAMIDSPWRLSCERLLGDHEARFRTARGASHNHQVWEGGYWDHITEVMNLACVLHDQLSSLRPLPFSKSDALLVLFLHDLEKPWRFTKEANGEWTQSKDLNTEEDKRRFRSKILAQYDIVLTPDQYNALTYVHGELDDYRSDRRVINELGVLCHSCDYLSARLWYDHAKPSDDPWAGAKRSAPRSPSAA